ncbi:hypothetical protein P7C70_g8113, partial [Phenoliferia sp. Uapishka_3]
MVAFSEQLHSFNAPLAYVTLAHNLRFPSPYSSHVLSSDVISRSFEPPSTLRTTRLILKRGKMPPWAPRSFTRIGTSWVVEVTECDLEREEGKELRVKSRNIDHKTIMEVVEWQMFQQLEDDPLATKANTITRVTSEFGFAPIQRRIEKFGISRGAKSTEHARAGLALIVSLLLSPLTSGPLLSSGPLNPYPFDPLPTNLALASEIVRAKFEEARRLRGGAPIKDVAEDDSPKKRLWRERWRQAASNGVTKFRSRVCDLTGLLCDKKGV